MTAKLLKLKQDRAAAFAAMTAAKSRAEAKDVTAEAKVTAVKEWDDNLVLVEKLDGEIEAEQREADTQAAADRDLPWMDVDGGRQRDRGRRMRLTHDRARDRTDRVENGAHATPSNSRWVHVPRCDDTTIAVPACCASSARTCSSAEVSASRWGSRPSIAIAPTTCSRIIIGTIRHVLAARSSSVGDIER